MKNRWHSLKLHLLSPTRLVFLRQWVLKFLCALVNQIRPHDLNFKMNSCVPISPLATNDLRIPEWKMINFSLHNCDPYPSHSVDYLIDIPYPFKRIEKCLFHQLCRVISFRERFIDFVKNPILLLKFGQSLDKLIICTINDSNLRSNEFIWRLNYLSVVRFLPFLFIFAQSDQCSNQTLINCRNQ